VSATNLRTGSTTRLVNGATASCEVVVLPSRYRFGRSRPPWPLTRIGVEPGHHRGLGRFAPVEVLDVDAQRSFGIPWVAFEFWSVGALLNEGHPPGTETGPYPDSRAVLGGDNYLHHGCTRQSLADVHAVCSMSIKGAQ